MRSGPIEYERRIRGFRGNKTDALEHLRDMRTITDYPLWPWLVLFNSLPGIYTLQSCSGHAPEDAQPGHVWLRFENARPNTESLSFDHQWLDADDGWDVLEITFGGERTNSLYADLDSVWDWLKQNAYGKGS